MNGKQGNGNRKPQRNKKKSKHIVARDILLIQRVNMYSKVSGSLELNYVEMG
jgi:hypothetical protein